MDKKTKRVLTFVGVLLVIAAAWVAFSRLVKSPPIGTNPALIMVWLSVLVLLLGLFPSLLKRVKRIGYKDFEIEFQMSVESASKTQFITLDEPDNYIFSRKGNLSNLFLLLNRVARYPGKPVLLVADVGERGSTTIPFLYVYLQFLDLKGADTILLFVTDSEDEDREGKVSEAPRPSGRGILA